MKSLGEILDRGLYHTALEGTFRARNAVEQRESDASRRARIKRVALRQAVEAVLDEHRLAALVYPTLRRKPARIGDAQSGTDCQVSAHSGLPALACPPGFTDDGVPVGIESARRGVHRAGAAVAWLRHRADAEAAAAPFSTPALVAGKRPAPRTTTAKFSGSALSLSYDETMSRLQYTLSVDPKAADRLSGVWVHVGTREKPGAARHQLFGSGQPATGSVTLGATDRKALAEGRLLVRFYPRAGIAAISDVPVTFTK